MEIPKELNNEIWDYCRVNNITNIDEFTLKLLKQGFTIEKYGSTPMVTTKEKIVEKIIAKDPENPSFKAFLHDQGFKEDQLSIKEWGLNELMLCALFFNTKIEIE
mgnify:CR=1 FL=1